MSTYSLHGSLLHFPQQFRNYSWHNADITAQLSLHPDQDFVEVGGEEYTMIPCMNVHPLWVEAIANYVEGVAKGEREMVL